MDRKLLKKIILTNNLIDEDRLRELEALSVSSAATLTQTVIGGGYVKEDVLLPLIGEYFDIKWVDLEKIKNLDPSIYGDMPDTLKDSQQFLPLYKDNGKVVVGVSNIIEVDELDRLRVETKWEIEVVLSTQEKLDKARERFESAGKSVEDALSELGGEQSREKSLEELANEAPTIKKVNLIIMQAISEGVSDIHIEPYENKAVVRYRSDGVLKENAVHSKEHYPAIISRIKIMADLNIAERRIPQDGRISLKLMNKKYDLRVATIPTLFGEGVVMRILDKSNVMVGLTDLGFSEAILKSFQVQLKKTHGIILVTGPTGSGKTTTLYAALSSIKSETNKIITIEDPVEYNLDGITQIHVNTQVGLTFAAGLRSVLRLDPDVVMVGEIRDGETAEIAIRAALTGHLVFSTLHTNDAPSAVSRLTDMGVAPYLISSSLNAVLAQRLVRKICEFCKTEIAPDAKTALLFRESGIAVPGKVYKGKGCSECSRVGYSGRAGIHEFLEMSESLREAVGQKATIEEIQRILQKEGMKTMRDDGVLKMGEGLTTYEEVLRVTQSD